MHVGTFAVCCSAILMLNTICRAEPGFELQLKELKKPSLPLGAKKSRAAAKQAAKTAESPAKTRKTTASAPKKQAKTVEAAKPAAIAPETLPKVAEMTFTPGLPCRLAGQIADTIATPVSAVELQQGFRLAPVAMARHEEITTVITCGLPDAEAYTIARLLATRNLQMLNIEGTESPEQVVGKVVNSLGFSYRTEQQDGGSSYLLALDAGQEKLLRLVISP